MIKVDIVGLGNVGTHLRRALSKTADVASVNPRTFDGLRRDCEICFIAVSDSAIDGVAQKISERLASDSILVHTSGSTPISVLENKSRNTGVFYPLQTFSKEVELNYENLPVLIEANNEATENSLRQLAAAAGFKSSAASSEQRKSIHLAAVICCNFVNHLWHLSDDYLKRNNLDFKLLLPLIGETFGKISKVSPRDAQTGPASRHDMKTLEKHLDMLENNEELRTIYKILSDSIMKYYAR